jgi:tripartite-type tricarboxylate transporter receptor subunit TctC
MIDLLHRELANVMADPEIQTGMLEIGADPVTSSPAEFRALISAEIVKWSSLIKQMNITAE